MKPSTHDASEIDAIFRAASQCAAPQAREDYLAQACGNDGTMLAKVRALLRSEHAATSDPADVTLALSQEERAAMSLGEKPGDLIGRYTLLHLLGEGGFGSVWAAEQSEPVRREVALKIVKLGMDTRNVIARFEQERQALAVMDHPNIAKVLDGGATPSGRPYFVMELVKGEQITRFCDQQQLPMTERLLLFVQVCHAVQHAHQKGIIHRDLKPSNILVSPGDDGRPVPRVIDFGIAKAVTPLSADASLLTQMDQFIGTPAYMSPEQARLGEGDIDTRSDIYSLGVLLYELLTGMPPFDPQTLRGAGLEEMRRRIREEEPPRPSTRLSTVDETRRLDIATSRKTPLPKLVQSMRGDLDWVVMKALEKDRARRYDTVSGLAHDLERYIRREPVAARPPSVAYALGKFLQRNKRSVAAVSSIALLFCVSFFCLVYAYFTRKHTLETLFPENETRLVAELRSRLLVETSRLRLGRSEDLWLQMLADFYEGEDRWEELGKLYAKEIELRTKSGHESDAALVDISYDLAGHYQAQGKLAEAEALCIRGMEVRRRMLGEEHHDTLISMRLLATLYEAQGKLAEAEALYTKLLEVQRRVLGKGHPDAIDTLSSLFNIFYDQNKWEAAESLKEEEMELRRKPNGRQDERFALAAERLGSIRIIRKHKAEAEAPLREALAVRIELMPDDWLRFNCESYLGDLLRQLKKLDEAEPLLRSGYEGLKARLSTIPTYDKRKVVWAVERLATLAKAKGDEAEASKWTAEAEQLSEQISKQPQPKK